jgi:hypothetical protein
VDFPPPLYFSQKLASSGHFLPSLAKSRTRSTYGPAYVQNSLDYFSRYIEVPKFEFNGPLLGKITLTGGAAIWRLKNEKGKEVSIDLHGNQYSHFSVRNLALERPHIAYLFAFSISFFAFVFPGVDHKSVK